MVPVAFNTRRPGRRSGITAPPMARRSPKGQAKLTKGRPLKPTYDPQWASLGPVHEDTQDFAQSMAISDGLVLAVTEHSLGNV